MCGGDSSTYDDRVSPTAGRVDDGAPKQRDVRPVVLPLIEPMLASSGPIPGSADDWAFEPKLDGWRAMVYVADGWLMVRTRTGRNVTDQLPEVARLPDVLDRRAVVLDGELVAHQGTPRSFYRLGPRMAARSASAESSCRKRRWCLGPSTAMSVTCTPASADSVLDWKGDGPTTGCCADDRLAASPDRSRR